MIEINTLTKELACWIGDYAAYNCYILNNKITIFAPVQTPIISGSNFLFK